MQFRPIRFQLENGSQAARAFESIAKTWPTRVDRSWRRRTTYYDTFDWRVLSASRRLWSEQGSRSTILRLTPLDQTRGLQSKITRLPSFIWELPQGPLRDHLEPIVGVRRLLDMTSILAHGDVMNILDKRDKTVAVLRFEHSTGSTILGSKKRVDLPDCLTLIPVRGYADDFAEVLRILSSDLGLQPAAESELVEAAIALGLNPGGYSKRLDLALDPQAAATDAMMKIHRKLFEIMRANELGLRLDLDSEFLHEFRVSVRRTRSALSQVKGVFPESVCNHFRDEFSWLGQITGPCRDLHVYQLKFPAYRSSLPAEIRDDLDPLRVFLDRHQRIEHRDLVDLLDSDRYQKLKRDWKQFLSTDPSGQVSEPPSPNPIVKLASERIWRSYKRVIKKGSAIGPQTPAKALHRLRIDCKKLRYLLEFFRSLYPEAKVGLLIEELKRLQDNLGDFNDFEVQQDRLRKYGQTMVAEQLAPAATMLAMGRLIERLEEGHARERERFRRRFEKFSAPKNHRLFRRLFKPRKEPKA